MSFNCSGYEIYYYSCNGRIIGTITIADIYIEKEAMKAAQRMSQLQIKNSSSPSRFSKILNAIGNVVVDMILPKPEFNNTFQAKMSGICQYKKGHFSIAK